MESQQIIHLKAEAFDRIVQTYRELEKSSGFTMTSWLIFTEKLESELRKIKLADETTPRP